MRQILTERRVMCAIVGRFCFAGARATPGNGDISGGECRPARLAEIRRDKGREQLVHDELLEG